MTAELLEETTLADELALIEGALDRIQLGSYARQSPEQARRNAAALRRIESRVATHVGVSVRAVASTTPGKTASQRMHATTETTNDLPGGN